MSQPPEQPSGQGGRSGQDGTPAWPSTDADWPTTEPTEQPTEQPTGQQPGGNWQAGPRPSEQPTQARFPVQPPAQPPNDQPTVRAMPVRIESAADRQPGGPPPNQPPGEPPAQPPDAQRGPGWQSAPEPAQPRRRRRHPVLWSLLVLLVVVGLAAAAVFAVPGVASRIGLPKLDPARTELDPPEPIAVRQQLRAATGKAATPDGVSEALREVTADPALGRLTGVVLDAASGTPLWNSDPKTPLAPGSTNKLLVAAAALLALDPQQRLSTKVVEGEQPGSAVIVGGGDPTLTALSDGEVGVYPDPSRLDDLVAQVKRSGRIERVAIDEGAFRGGQLADGWLRADIAAGNFTPIVPGMLDGGRSDPQELNSPRTDDPSGELLTEFADRVGASADGAGAAPENAKVLGEVRSAPVEDLVATLLDTSDNVLAELLGRQVAMATGKPPSFDGATSGVLQTLRENGFDTTGAEISDNSGLSTENRLPARLLATILGAAASDTADPRTAKLRPMLAGLPVAGGTGTLAEGRFADPTTVQGKGYVRAKTGTLSDVSSLAGVVLDTDGRLLVFAMMSNGTSPADARPALDGIATTLRECGC